jgi:hypothetical protein
MFPSRKGYINDKFGLEFYLLAKSELGRQPLDSFIKTQVMLYSSRIQLDGINPLVKEAFNINKNISNENFNFFVSFK